MNNNITINQNNNNLEDTQDKKVLYKDKDYFNDLNNNSLEDYDIRYRELKEQNGINFDSKYDKYNHIMLSFDDIYLFAKANDVSKTQYEYINRVVKALYKYGFEKPSNVQTIAVFPIINNNDCIVQANSGTGKTATFLLSSMLMVDPLLQDLQIIIIANTKELAEQIYTVACTLFADCEVSFALHVGGFGRQYTKYPNKSYSNYNEQIVIGTPGKILDLLDKNKLNKSKLHLLVLDEADCLLDDNLLDTTKDILCNHINTTIKISIFSATLPTNIINLTNKFMKSPIIMTLPEQKVNLKGIIQYQVDFLNSPKEDVDKDKIDTLIDLLISLNSHVTIVFFNNKKLLDNIYHTLEDPKYGINALCIHGNFDTQTRIDTINKFKDSMKHNVLLCSNVLARGIDIHKISLVINFDIPKKPEDYIHRIGRTGRHGRTGKAINFITKYNEDDMDIIKKKFDIKLEDLPMDLNI